MLRDHGDPEGQHAHPGAGHVEVDDPLRGRQLRPQALPFRAQRRRGHHQGQVGSHQHSQSGYDSQDGQRLLRALHSLLLDNEIEGQIGHVPQRQVVKQHQLQITQYITEAVAVQQHAGHVGPRNEHRHQHREEQDRQQDITRPGVDGDRREERAHHGKADRAQQQHQQVWHA